MALRGEWGWTEAGRALLECQQGKTEHTKSSVGGGLVLSWGRVEWAGELHSTDASLNSNLKRGGLDQTHPIHAWRVCGPVTSERATLSLKIFCGEQEGSKGRAGGS